MEFKFRHRLDRVLAFVLLASAAAAAEPRTLTIIAEVPEGTGAVYLPGNLPELGPWQPNKFLMEGTGTERTATLSVPEGTEVEFKFTQGEWFNEAVAQDCTTRINNKVTVTGDITLRTRVERFRSADVECPWPDVARWEEAIAAFEAADAQNPPPQGAFLATGSSTIALWHKTIREDFAPLTVIPRGFGGSTMNDLVHYAPRVVLPYRPATILVYEGDNDISAGVFPATVIERYRDFVTLVHAELPETRIYFLSIKPSASRIRLWDRMQEVNEGIKALCAEDPRLTYIDTASMMLDEKGVPRDELFLEDKLHMNPKAYALWTQKVRAELGLE